VGLEHGNEHVEPEALQVVHAHEERCRGMQLGPTFTMWCRKSVLIGHPRCRIRVCREGPHKHECRPARSITLLT
jgi:hypothetical protein